MTDRGAASSHEEFPGSVGVTPAVTEESVIGDPSGLDFSGGIRFWLASATLVGVLALVVGVTVLIRYGTDEANEAPAVAAGPVTELSVGASEFSFDPSNVEIVAGEEITLDFVNNGATQHIWVVLEQGVRIQSEDEFDPGTVLFETALLDGGASETDTFTIDDTGTYQVICTVAGHLAAGMQGTLVAS